MSFLYYFKKISFIDQLIKRKATGSQKELAHKTGLSKSTLNRYLSEMRELGFPIKYSKKRCSYYYETEGEMVKKLFGGEKLEDAEMKKINGGKGSPFFINYYEK